MKLKIIFGLILPLSIILILVALSISGIGMHIATRLEQRVSYEALGRSSSSNIPVMEIDIENDFFLPRRSELPFYTICLSDKESGARTYLQYKYMDPGSNSPVGSLVLEYEGQARPSIELPSYSRKTITLLVSSYGVYEQQLSSYDEIILLERADNSYGSCNNIGSSQMAKAIHIPIQ